MTASPTAPRKWLVPVEGDRFDCRADKRSAIRHCRRLQPANGQLSRYGTHSGGEERGGVAAFDPKATLREAAEVSAAVRTACRLARKWAARGKAPVMGTNVDVF